MIHAVHDQAANMKRKKKNGIRRVFGFCFDCTMHRQLICLHSHSSQSHVSFKSHTIIEKCTIPFMLSANLNKLAEN